MTDKALEAAHAAYAKTTGGILDGHPMANAISAYLSALPGEAEVVMEQIAHKEQIGIWANELTSALSLSDFLREDWSFDDSVDLEKEVAAQLLDIIRSAITHPGLNLVASLQAMQARAEAAEAALAQLDGGSDHADDILAASAKFQCHECIAEEREFSCHDLEDMVIVEGKVVCKECVAEFYPKARAKPAPDIGKKLRRQRMFARQQQARAEAAEARVKELEGAFHVNVTDQELVRLNNMAVGTDEVTISSRMMLTLVGCIIAARSALKGGSNG